MTNIPMDHFPTRTTRQLRERLSVLLDQLDPEERRVWEDQIRRTAYACGCKEGTVGFAIGVCVMIIVRAADSSWLRCLWRQQVLLVFGVVLLSAVIGKVYGMIAGRLRARDVLSKLSERLT